MSQTKNFGLSVCALLAMTAVSQAQIRDAGSKIRGEAMAGHEAVTYQQSARSHAQTLYYYTQTVPATSTSMAVITPAKAQEHVKSLESDIVHAQQAMDVLKAKYAEDKQAQTAIKSIENHLGEAKSHCGTCAAECLKSDLASAKLMECCVDMFHHLDDAQSETTALLKHLKLDKLAEMPKKAASSK